MAESTEFNLEVQSGPDGTTVSVSGELDAYTAPQLRKMLDEALDTTPAGVVVDLSATSFIDSTGLGVLVGGSRKAKSRDGELVIESPSRSVYRVLQITGLTLTIPVRNAPPSDADDDAPGVESKGEATA